jgi:hypothetical protein
MYSELQFFHPRYVKKMSPLSKRFGGLKHNFIKLFYDILLGRDSAVGLATRYGLNGPGMNSKWGRDSCICPDRPWSPPSLLYNEYQVVVDRPHPSSAEVKQRVEPYRYSSSGP